MVPSCSKCGILIIKKLVQNVGNINPTSIKGNDVYELFHTLYVNDPSTKFFTDEKQWKNIIKDLDLTKYWVHGIR